MFLEAPPKTDNVQDLYLWCHTLWLKLQEERYSGNATWDPGSIDDGNEEAKEVTVTGAALGDHAIAAFSLDVSDLVLDAQVTAANTVTCILANNTGVAVDLGSGTVYVRVFKRTT